MAKRVYLVIARQGGGKGTATDILKRILKASSRRFSDPMREFADIVGLAQEREPLQKIGQAGRRIFGADCWERGLIRFCEQEPAEDVIIDGAREPGDIGNFLKHPSFNAILIEASAEKRFGRIVAREIAAGRKPPTHEEFLIAEDHVNERSIRDMIALIRRVRPDRLHVIDNEEDGKDLEPDLIRLVAKLKAA